MSRMYTGKILLMQAVINIENLTSFPKQKEKDVIEFQSTVKDMVNHCINNGYTSSQNDVKMEEIHPKPKAQPFYNLPFRVLQH